LTDLRDGIVGMGHRAGRLFAKAIIALGDEDKNLAAEVIAGDDDVDDLQAQVEALTVKLLAKRQPIAVDLRMVIASLKIASDLERIADHAVGIARNVQKVRVTPELEPHVNTIRHMSRIGQRMLDNVLAAYADHHDCEQLVPEILAADREINRTYWDMLGEIQTGMGANSAVINAGTALIYIGRSCERIGDHLKNVAESVYYMVNGAPYEPPSA
jgi:phosphate transport system protein